MLPNTDFLDEITMVATTRNMPPLDVEYLHRDVTTLEEPSTIQQQATQATPERRTADRAIAVHGESGSDEYSQWYDPTQRHQPTQSTDSSSASSLEQPVSDDEPIDTKHSLPLLSSEPAATVSTDPGPSCSFQISEPDIPPSQDQSSSDESVEEAEESSSTASHLTSSETGRDTKELKCRLCDYKGQTRRSLKHHLSYHHHVRLDYQPIPITEFSCHQCNYVAKRRDLLKRHQRTHMTKAQREQLKTFSCPLCSRKFERSDHLKKHMMSHKN